MENNVPRDILDGIRDAFGRKVKLVIKRLVKYEVKPDKIESRILVMTNWRLYLLSAKPPFKPEVNIHILDLKAIESKKPNQMTFVTSDGKRIQVIALEVETEEFDHVIINIGTSIKTVFPNVSLDRLIGQLDVLPAKRIKPLYDLLKDIEARDLGPCGGFSRMYACMCDYNMLPYREEVSWDIDTIYLSHDNKELSLGDFDHLDSRDLVPIIAALEYNAWFTKLNASDVKLCSEAAAEILKVMQKNTSIEEIHLSGVGVKNDFAQKLSTAILSNSQCPLTTIDLSNNYIEDKGMNQLCGPVSKLSKGLVCLKLAKTGITAKGVNRLADSLAANPIIATSLKVLDLSENILRNEEVTSLYNFLAQPNAISTLKLSGTECALDMLSGALLRGCCSHLEYLDLSRNVFTHKKIKDPPVPLTWKQFFGNSLALKTVNLADNKLPPEAVKNVLLGLSSNVQLHDLEVNLRGNDLRGVGAQVLEICLPDVTNVVSLDISDNGFGEDIVGILQKLPKNRVLRKLFLGQNFSSVKSKHIQQVLEAIVQFIEVEHSPITSLSVANSKLGKDTAIIINALGSNTSLTELDISGNYMGDLGARMLAKALMINTHLSTVYWDKNLTSAQGFADVAAALEKNYTVKKMPTPVNDAASALRSSPEKTEAILEKIEGLLQRNHSPRKFACDQAYRLQQCFLISSTQQMLDRQVVQIQDTINALQRGSTNSRTQNDIERAQLLLKDADNSKLLLPRLQEVALKSEAEGNAIDLKLRSVAHDVLAVIEEQLRKNVADMISSASDHCPTITKNPDLSQEVREECGEKSTLPKDFTHGLIVQQVGTDTMNKVSELNLAVASCVSERLIDNVIESLTETHKTLTNRLNEQLAQIRVDERKQKVEKDQLVIQQEKDDVEKPSPGASPKLVTNKRTSLHNRRVRPQSQIEIMSRDESDTAASSQNTNGALKGKMPPKSQTLPEFPTPIETPSQQLTHVTKSRPKRARTKPPSRVALTRVDTSEETPDGDVQSFFQSASVSTTVVSTPSPKIEVSSTPERSTPTPASPTKKPVGGKSPFGGAMLDGIHQGLHKMFSKKSNSPASKSPEVATKRYSMISEESSTRASETVTPPAARRTTSRSDDKVEATESTPSTTSEVTKTVTETAEKEEEAETVPEPVIRRPAGVPKVGLPGMMPGMGLGRSSLLEEMKLKRTTITTKTAKVEVKEKKDAPSPAPAAAALSRDQPPSVKGPAPPAPSSAPPLPTSTPPLVTSAPPLVTSAPPLVYSAPPLVTSAPRLPTSEPPQLRPKEDQLPRPVPMPRSSSPGQLKEESLKPTPAPRSASPKGLQTPGDRTSKPPPPTKPKPKIIAPKPRIQSTDSPKSVSEKRLSSGVAGDTSTEKVSAPEAKPGVVEASSVKLTEEKDVQKSGVSKEEKADLSVKEESKVKEGVPLLDANRNEQIVLPAPAVSMSFVKTKSASLPRSPKVTRREEEPTRARSFHDGRKRLSDDFLSKQASISKQLVKNGSKTPDSSSTDSLLEDTSLEEAMEIAAVKIPIVSESSTDSPIPPEQQSSSGRTSEEEDLLSEDADNNDLVSV